MKSRDYWRERFNQLEEAQNRRGMECAAEIEKQYRRAQRRIEEKIDRWYQRFADNNGIDMQEAQLLLHGRDLEEFRWDVQDYIQHGKENAVNGRWMKQLENASDRYHISRMEAINIQIQQGIESLYGRQLDSVESAMRDIYINGYYHTAFEIQKGVGVAWNFATLDERTIDKVIHTPWATDGKNFSERIWQNRQRLVKELNTELVQNIILGEDPQRAIDAIAKKMNVSQNNAGRLVMTEEAFFSSAAHKDCFNELGVERYEIVATLDSHTSETCRKMDGKGRSEHEPFFYMSEWEVGVTAPPFHVWCRSTTVPAFGDEFDNIGSRAARGKDGKTEYVPADMTYNEWKASFVDGSDKSEAKEMDIDDIINFRDITKEWTEKKGIKGTVSNKQEYMVNGKMYEVDGKHVILHPDTKEQAMASVLSEKYGKNVEFVPQVVFPQGIQTPDYMIDGDRFDLKSPIGMGTNLIYGLIAKKRKQSDNFVIDISNCPLSIEEVEMQIENLYTSPRTGFLEKVVLMKSGEILKVYGRK